MKIAIFTTAHPLDDVRVYSKFARSFLSHGYSLAWIGPAKSYFSGDSFRDGSISYDVYKSKSGRLARLLGMPRSAMRLARHRGSDWIYCPDPDAAAIAVLLRPLHGADVVFDVHEEYHTGMLARWLGARGGKMASRLLVKCLQYVVSKARIVVGVSSAVLSPYEDHLPAYIVVKNSAPEWFSEIDNNVPSSDIGLRLFHGKSSPTNGTVEILQALDRVSSDVEVLMIPSSRNAEDPPYMSNFHDLVRSYGVVDKLVLSDSVPHTAIPALMDTCHVGMIGYNRELGRASLPNRLFEYMARGLPIMAPTYSPLIREIIEEHELGICRDFEDPESIAEGIRWFQDHPEETSAMGARAREVFLKEFSWTSEFDKLDGLMNHIKANGSVLASDLR